MKEKAIDHAWQGPPQCRHCAIRHLVLFADLEHEDFNLIHQPIDEMSFNTGELIYQAGSQPDYIYTLRQGLVKLVQYLPDGSQRIVRLLRQGDIIGLEATLGETYHHEAIALEPIEVCRIPMKVVERLGRETPRLQKQLLNRWNRALSTADTWLTELSTGPAQARVARLLLRLAECHNSETFYLPGREDIGAILGITTETASRVIADLKRSGLVEDVATKRVRVNVNALDKMAG